MTTEDLYQDQWLLSYEASVQGWLPSDAVTDHIGIDPGFEFLRRNGVSFYASVTNPFVAGALQYP